MEHGVTPAQAGVSLGQPERSPQGDPDLRGDGQIGTLAGIARHGRPKGPMETIDHVAVTIEGGIAGDFRGGMKGRAHKRQVSLIERGDWDLAMAEVGHSIPWQERRANLLVDGLDLPQTKGVRLRIGEDVLLQVMVETDPCERMEKLAVGLRAALTPDWRGGVCTMVLAGGEIRIGDKIRVEQA